MYMKDNKQGWIDGVKGIGAIVIAFMWHYQHFAPENGTPFSDVFVFLYGYGYVFVDVFFALSGFGMVLGYEERIYSGNISFKQYIKHRLLKLYPFMALTLVAITVLQAICRLQTGTTFIYGYFDVYHFILNLLGLQMGILDMQYSFNGPCWTLTVTLVMYIVYFIVLRLASKINREVVLYMYIIASLLGGVIVISKVFLPILNPAMGRGLLGYFLGCMLAKGYLWSRCLSERTKQKVGYLSLGVSILLYCLGRKYGFDLAWGDVLMTTVLALIPWLSHVFTLSPLLWVGKLSIAVYFVHFPVQCLWKIVDTQYSLGLDFSSLQVFFLYPISTVIIAYAVNRCCLVSVKWIVEQTGGQSVDKHSI